VSLKGLNIAKLFKGTLAMRTTMHELEHELKHKLEIIKTTKW
jgi:hypothetical protein